MVKRIDLNKTVYELNMEYPEITGILTQVGFSEMGIPGMLQTAGRYMTLPKGAAMKKIDLDMIRMVLKENGFEVIG